jgi:2-keto-3-deoxy-L-rhamnonate aldolase RhmA
LQNDLLTAFENGGSVACVWLSVGSPVLAEFAAEAGALAVVIDLQHGLWERGSAEAAIGHIRKTAVALVRVAENRPHAIGEALDAGALGVIVPVVETAAEARLAIAAAKYPPMGIRSAGGIRPLRDFAAYVAAANREILVAVMIETARGLENIDEIVKVEGVDLIFIGPGDLALSLGEFPVAAAKLAAAIDRILATCKASGVPCGIFTGTAEDAGRRLGQGFQFVTACNDISLNREGMKQAFTQLQGGGSDS